MRPSLPLYFKIPTKSSIFGYITYFFLGVIFDSEKMTLEVTPDRVVEISLLVESWLKKKKIIFKRTSISFRKVAFYSWLRRHLFHSKNICPLLFLTT
jgi:hypothetical protein